MQVNKTIFTKAKLISLIVRYKIDYSEELNCKAEKRSPNNYELVFGDLVEHY